MELEKLIYDVRESLSTISDDRRIDDRYIEHLINVGRESFIKKLLSTRPSYNTINLEQNWHANIESVSKSIFPGVVMSCKVLRSTAPIPSMITSDVLAQQFRVRTADITMDTIEVISAERANKVTFEFNVVYAFLDYEHYLYFLSKDGHQELKYAVVTGIFNDPKDVEDPLTDYPISGFMWEPIKNNILALLNSRPIEDPINNSEPDYMETNAKKDK